MIRAGYHVIHLLVLSSFYFRDLRELDQRHRKLRAGNWENVAGEFKDILVEGFDNRNQTLEHATKGLLATCRRLLRLVHGLIAEGLELCELMVNRQEVRRGPNYLFRICSQHGLERLKTSIHL